MAVKLNLLPSDYTVSGSVAAVLKVVRPLNVILLAIFLVTALGVAGFFIVSLFSLNNLNASNDSLKNQIQSQQTAQQQVVLLKDRLVKIRSVLSEPGASKNLALLSPVIGQIGVNSSVSELDIDAQKTVLTVNFKSNSDLTSFIKNLPGQNTFLTISLDSFTYSPAVGFTVGFAFSGK